MRFANKIPFVIALFLLTVPLFARTYSTTFTATENPICDGSPCNWTGGGAAGGNLWGNVQTKPGLAFGVSAPTQYGDPTAVLAGTWGDNQTVQGTVKVSSAQPTTSCCHEIELRLRLTISANSVKGYEAYCSMIAGNQYCHIASWGGPNGAYVNLDTCAGGGSPSRYLINGDVLKATVTGTNPVTIKLYINDTQVMTVEDTGSCTFSDGNKYGPWTSGNPGIGMYDSMDSNWSSYGWSSFSATDGGPLPPSGLSTVVK
jgi:hypothetical protein